MISGCSCSYSLSKEDYESHDDEYDAKNLIYINDLGTNGLIYIDDKPLLLKSLPADPNLPLNDYKYTDSHKRYTVYTQNAVAVDEGYENTFFETELVIEDQQGQRKIVPVYGSCGC